MSWFTLTDEERQEFRKSIPCRALLEEIEVQVRMARDEVVSIMLDEDTAAENRARRIAGRVDGMEVVKHIIERDA